MTDSHRAPSRHVSVWIDADAATVYGYVSNPVNLPQWAAGLADGAPRQVDGRWVVTSPMGEVNVEFAPTNTFGVVDHTVRSADGQAFYNPMRIIPDGDSAQRCEVVFTVRRQPGADDAVFTADVAAVQADLMRLQEVVESQRSR